MHTNHDDRSEATDLDLLAGIDQLVGVCLSGPADRTECRRADGDVLGFLLGHGTDGWWVLAEHVSSDPSWSRIDIDGHRRRTDPAERLTYEWAGWLSSGDLRAKYPPAVAPLVVAAEGSTSDGTPQC